MMVYSAAEVIHFCSESEGFWRMLTKIKFQVRNISLTVLLIPRVFSPLFFLPNSTKKALSPKKLTYFI